MKRSTDSIIVSQLKGLTSEGHRVMLDRISDRYWEVTVFEFTGPNHHHYQGETLAEAVNRAVKGEADDLS